MLLDFLYVRSALLKHNPANQKGVEGGTRLCQYQKAVHHCRSFRKDKKENRTRENKKKVSQKEEDKREDQKFIKSKKRKPHHHLHMSISKLETAEEKDQKQKTFAQRNCNLLTGEASLSPAYWLAEGSSPNC
jgi:hypothetical protein